MKVKTKGGQNLDQMRDMLRDAPQILDAMVVPLAEEALDLVRDGFRKETDPYGDKWQEKKVPDGRKVLHGESSNLRLGWHVEKTGPRKATIAPTVAYASVHQHGFSGLVTRKGKQYSVNVPARMMIPGRSRGLPAGWRKALSDAATDVIREYARSIGASSGVRFAASIRAKLNIAAIIRRALKEAS